MSHLTYIEDGIVYQNPRPHARSRHGYFPGLVALPSGELLALVVIGEAFESANSTTYVFRSCDRGKTWDLQGPLYDKSVDTIPTSDYLKPAILRDGSLVAIGYRYHRFDPESPIGIDETGGILPGDDIISFSVDDGRSWTVPTVIPRSYPELLEISGPCLQSHSGDLLALATMLPLPDGTNPSGSNGVLLRSRDSGRTWSDNETFFQIRNRRVSPYESRVCEMDDQRLVAISWAFDQDRGMSLPNHVVVSRDDGCSWSAPMDTGQCGQTANLQAAGGDYLLAIQAHRVSEQPGIYVRLIDFAGDRWKTVEELLIYGPGARSATSEDQDKVRMFASLRFGQPSLLRLNANEVLATHWCIEDGQGKIRLHRLSLQV